MVSSLLSRKAPSKPVLVALAVGLLGLGLIVAPSLAQGSSELDSTLAILAALASYGVAANLAGPLQRRSGALPVIWRALGIAVLLTAPFGAPAMLGFHWQTGPVVSMLALGGLGTALANVVMAFIAGRVSASAASAPIFLIPVVSVPQCPTGGQSGLRGRSLRAREKAAVRPRRTGRQVLDPT